jgi:predicted transcriptional regulator
MKSYLKKGKTVQNIFVDPDTGEIVGSNTKTHTYLADTKEEFFLLYSSVLGIFNMMEQSEIRVFSFLLQYADGTKFSIDRSMRLEISKSTTLNERTIYNTVKKLEMKNLIFRHDTGAYQVNPRYAFRGSTSDRNQALKTILELGYSDVKK